MKKDIESKIDCDKFVMYHVSELHWSIVGVREALCYYFVNNLHFTEYQFKKWWVNKLETFIVPKEY